jgi:WD40 repeat protein
MQSQRVLLLSMILGALAAQGCGTKSAVVPPAASDPAATNRTAGDEASRANPSVAGSNARSSAATTLALADPPQNTTPVPPPKPSAEQIAKWGIPTYQPLKLLACRDGFADPAVLCLALAPEGKQFVLGGAKLTLWNLKDAKPFVEMMSKYSSEEVERPLPSVAISADGKWLAAGDQKGRLRVWTLKDQRELLAITAHNGRLTQLVFSPDSQRLATTSYAGEVNLWQMPEGKKLRSLKVSDQEVTRLAFLSDKLLACAGSEASIWNVESGEKVAALTTKYVIGPALGLSSDRRILAFNDSESTTQFWDVPNSKPTGLALRSASAYLIEFSPDGKRIATYSQDSNIRIWDAATGSVVQIIDADGGRTSALKWLPGTSALLVASEQGRVRIWGTPDDAQAIGVQPIQLPTLAAVAAGDHKALSSARLQQVMDLRSFPRLPGGVTQWSDYGMCAYNVQASQQDAELFYRYNLGQAGWTESAHANALQPGLVFRKDECELNVSFTPAADGALQVSLQFAGNYDARWLPKYSPTDFKGSWGSFSSVDYRTKADLTDVEVALLKQFHDAGWTAYTRLASSSNEDPKSRSISMLQGGSVLTVSIGYPADSTQELFVQTSISASNKSLPIPPDAGWIEFDSSTDLQLVANTKMDLKQTTQFYDEKMAADGWLAREVGRNFKDDKGWLPYIRGQQDVFLRLKSLPGGGTRIVCGDAASSSWQLKEPPKKSEKADEPEKEKPGIEAADFALPEGATAVKFEVDQKQIEFEWPGKTPMQLGEQFVAQMESAKWKREDAGVTSEEYVFITCSKGEAEIQLRARVGDKKATAMISGDGLLWAKPLPSPPVRVSYGSWLRRNQYDATLDRLGEFAAEMHKIPAGK